MSGGSVSPALGAVFDRLRERVAACDPRRARERLRGSRAATPKEAIDNLTTESHRFEPLPVFEAFFPEEFAEISKREAGPEESIRSILMERLLELINERLFPVHEHVFEDDDSGWFAIPVAYGMAGWDAYDHDPEDLPLGYGFALLLSEDWFYRKFDMAPVLASLGLDPANPPEIVSASEIDRDRLLLALGALPGPERHLQTLLDVLTRDTGRFFIDADPEMSIEDADWTAASVEWLTEDWRESLALLDACDRFTAWLAEAPRERALALIAVWNANREDRSRCSQTTTRATEAA